jgi:hypothetical protein
MMEIKYIILYLVPVLETVITYGSGFDFLTSYVSGSGYASQKVPGSYGSGSTTLLI